MWMLGAEIRAWHIDQEAFDAAAAEHLQLNFTDMRCLELIEQHRGMTAGQLAAASRLTSGAVTSVIDRLERAGLVRRTRDQRDQRRVRLETTPKVWELMKPVWEPSAEDRDAAFAAYGDRELELLLGFVRQSRDSVQRHTGRLRSLGDGDGSKRRAGRE